MLSQLKYIAIVSFILVSALAFFVGLYFRSFASDSVIRKPIENSYITTADYFASNIWCRYRSIFSDLMTQPVANWEKDRLFQKFVRLSDTVLKALPADKVSLYSSNGEMFFTTNTSQVTFFDTDGANNTGLQKSLSGSINSKLIGSMGLYDEAGNLQKGSYIQIFIPINTTYCTNKKPDEKELDPVIIEFFHKVTKPLDQLYFFQILVSIGIIITFLLIYCVLYISSKRAEKIINKQHEEKLNLEKAKSMAEAQNQQKSMFLANVSHELRTPLNAIIGFSEIIKDEVMGAVGHPQYKEYIADINSSGVHLLSLINDILDYSKAEARKLDVESVDIDLSKIAHSCLRLIEPRANEANVQLVEDLPDKHVVLAGDPKRMKQIVLNLLSNAVKFTQENGTVSLIIKESTMDGIVTLVVCDDGIGIAPKDISKAMSPFGQIDSSISRRYEGTGLGLPLTKKLTELMDGKFEIKSEVGLGTTITLVFPLVKDTSENDADKF